MSMRIDSRGEEKGTNPIYSPSCSLHLPAPPLLEPRYAAKLWRLRLQSSIRRPAPWSLVVSGGGGEVKRAMKEKNEAGESLSLLKRHSDERRSKTSSETTGKSKQCP